MSWQNPWAWLGLLALIVPVLIHLLARRAARVQPFPSLRFLDPTRLRPARRIRIRDPLLLLVRMAVLAAAVAALAQPVFRNASRARATTRLTRAIIVDSSASMLREPAAFAQAREASETVSGEESVGRIIVASEPARAIPGVIAWLATRPGMRELVIVSDFQVGEISASDLAAIPADVGIRLGRIEAPRDSTFEITAHHGRFANSARVRAAPDIVTVEWHVTELKASDNSSSAPLLLAPPEQVQHAIATLEAALATGAPLSTDTARRVAIVFPGYSGGAQLSREAQPLDQPWHGDLLVRLAADTTISRITRASVDGRNTLLLFTTAEPGTLAAAQLVSSVLHATAQSEPPDEFEPEVVAADVLAQWERAPSAGTPADVNTSHGRWFWLLALLMLGIESWLRRGRRHLAEAQYEHAA